MHSIKHGGLGYKVVVYAGFHPEFSSGGGGANVTLANVRGSEDFGGTLVLI